MTDEVIAARLRDLFAYLPDYSLADLHLLRIGRHFRLHPGLKIILGRNKLENEQIPTLARAGAVLFYPVDFRGPICLAVGTLDALAEGMTGEIMARYSQDEKDRYQIKEQILGQGESLIFVEKRFDKEAAAKLQIS